MTTEGSAEATPDLGDGTAENAEPATGARPLSEMSVEEQLDYFKGKARKAEDRLRDKQDPDIRKIRKERDQLARELGEIQEKSKTEAEKALDKARNEAAAQARAEAMAEFGAERVADAFRVAAAGRDIDVDGLLDDLKVEKCIGDDGTPNRDAVQQFVDRIAPAAEPGQPAPLDLGQGARGGQPPGLNSSQLEKDLKAKLGIS